MRYVSTNTYYPTAVSQYERVAGGVAWNTPANALASNGNVGTFVDNVDSLLSNALNWPVGPGYNLWGPTWNSPLNVPAFDFSENNLTGKVPNVLRFSGFNISEGGITGDMIVTNMYLTITYGDTTHGLVNGSYQVPISTGLVTNGTFGFQIRKSGNIQLGQKRLSLIKGTSNVVTETIPFVQDQSCPTDTFGSLIAPNSIQAHNNTSFPAGRESSRIIDIPYRAEALDLYDTDGWWATGDGKTGIPFIYYEPTIDIQQCLVSDINDSNFYIDLFYGAQSSSGLVTVYSVGLSIEYMKSSSKELITFANTVNSIPTSSTTIKPWTNTSLASGISDAPPASSGNYLSYGASFNAWYNRYPPVNPAGDGTDLVDSYDSELLIGKFNAIPDVDNTAQTISDLIIDVRFKPGAHGTNIPYPFIRWIYVLLNGYYPSSAPTFGQPIYTHAFQLFDPGVQKYIGQPGQQWLSAGPDLNASDRQYYNFVNGVTGRVSDFDSTGVTSNIPGGYFSVRHYPIRRNDPRYGSEIINTASFPGMTYDPLWIEKAAKAGQLYLGVIWGIDQMLQTSWDGNPSNTGVVIPAFIDSLSIRLKYNNVAVASAGADLLYRFSP